MLRQRHLFLDEHQQVADRNLVELWQGATSPFPAKRVRLQALPAAVRAGIVSTISRQKNADVHLVGILLKPAKETLHAVPIFWPRLPIFFTVAGLPVDDEI